MKKHDCQQGSVEWLELRAGLLTASEAGQLLTDKLAQRKPDSGMVQTLLATKQAEHWVGPLPSFGAWATEQGNLLEDLAIPAYELEYGVTVERVGFITDDSGRCGCSPDGLDGKTGLEIKSFQPVHHFKVGNDGGLTGLLPDDIAPQVHFSLWVTGFDLWKAFFYSRRIPSLNCPVERQDKIMATIQQAVDDFWGQFDLMWPKWVEKNGGPPPKRKPLILTPESQADPRAGMFKGVKDDQH